MNARRGVLRSVGCCAALLAAVAVPWWLWPRVGGASAGATPAGATLTVNSTADAVDASPGDGVCLTAAASAGSGTCTLRAAAMEANALAGEDTIALPAGHYVLSIAPATEWDLDGAATGNVDLTDDVVVAGAGAEVTVVHGPAPHGRWGVFRVARGAHAVLRALTVRDGDAPIGGGISVAGRIGLEAVTLTANTAGRGGAIAADAASVALIASAIVSNTAPFGAGIMAQHSDVAIDGSRLVLNVATHGGGVSLDGGRLDLRESQVRENRATYGAGILATDASVAITRSTLAGNDCAAVMLGATGDVTVSDSEIADNIVGIASGDEGAVLLLGSTLARNTFALNGGGTVTVVGSQLVRNAPAVESHGSALRVLDSVISGTVGAGIRAAPSSEGGTVVVARSLVTGSSEVGVSCAAAGAFTLADSTVIGNGGDSFGGGVSIHAAERGAHVVDRSTIARNRARYGGGLHVNGSGGVTVTNSTLSGNEAEYGSAIYAESSLLELASSTVSGAPPGGGTAGGGMLLLHRSTALLRDSILAPVDEPACESPTDGSSVVSAGGNVESGHACGLDPSADDRVDSDPMLGPFADNAGPTWTHALLEGSPAIDAGSKVACPSTDQRGAPRPQRDRCDSGAYEAGDAAIPPTPTPLADPGFFTDLIVRGRVTTDDPARHAVAGASVVAAARPGGACPEATTADDGTFELTCARAHGLGAVGVAVTAGGYRRWARMYVLGPYGLERGPVQVDARLHVAPPTATPAAPTPSSTPVAPTPATAATPTRTPSVTAGTPAPGETPSVTPAAPPTSTAGTPDTATPTTTVASPPTPRTPGTTLTPSAPRTLVHLPFASR